MLEMDVRLNLHHFALSAQLSVDSPMTALFGPTGAGKSTLLQIISGGMNAQKGWITFAGETLFDSQRGIRLSALRRRIGLISQDPTAYPPLPVRTHLDDAYAHPAQRRIQYDDAVQLTEIEGLLEKRSAELSDAEKQRVALAHALMSSPRLLLVDDYDKSNPAGHSEEFLKLLDRVRDSLGLPIIYVPRSIDDALRLTRRMIFIANGKILGAGDVNEVINKKLLLAAGANHVVENLMDVTIIGHDFENACTLAYHYGTELVLPLTSNLPVGQSVFVSVRANEISVSKKYLEGISIQNQMKGRIGTIIRAPEYAMVQIDCGTALLAVISLRALANMDLREGETVYCLIKAQAFSFAGQAG